MRILLILTGGTILSEKNENGLNDLNTDTAVAKLISKHEGIDVIAPINTLSENMTIDKWNKLIKVLRDTNLESYDGLMFLHGTDTLHLTSALMGVLLKDIGRPVMMVSAHRILSDPESNGVDNFDKSVALIEWLSARKMSGVYVIYRNMDGVSYVHHATHLEECGDYSEDFFSKDMIEYSKLIEDESLKWFKEETQSGGGIVRPDKAVALGDIGKLSDNVLFIKPYVGINYDRYSLDGVKAVLHGMYHSSTVNTEGDGATSALSLLRKCNALGIDFYIFPCKEGEFRYSSTKPLLEEGAKCLYGGTWEEAYVRLLIKYGEQM
ncbi:MAG: asparaginase [Eubacterium sp.]|nr:asparaginase [Eubacterium sp.]